MEAFFKLISQNAPWFWLSAAVLFGIVEAATAALATIWFAAAAFIMIFLSFLPLAFHWQLLIFALLSLTFFLLTRPLAVQKLKLRQERLNADAIVGKRLFATADISSGKKGSVKFNGLEWSAKCEDGSSIKSGEECVARRIEGVTVIVERIN